MEFNINYCSFLLEKIMDIEVSAVVEYSKVKYDTPAKEWVDITAYEEDLKTSEKEGLYDALDYLAEFQKDCHGVHIITVPFICDLHEKALKHDANRRGYLRRTQEDIVTTNCPFTLRKYTYPDPLHMEASLTELCDQVNVLIRGWCLRNYSDEKMIELGWISEKQFHVKHREIMHICGWFYYKFISLHPFLDGNGRVARLLLVHLINMLVPQRLALFDASVKDSRMQYIRSIVKPRIDNSKPLELTDMIVRSFNEMCKPMK